MIMPMPMFGGVFAWCAPGVLLLHDVLDFTPKLTLS